MILFVVPYSPHNSLSPNLGAARKIETVIKALSEGEDRIVVINSAHNNNSFAMLSESIVSIGGVDCIEVSPTSLPIRSLGKLFQVLFSGYFFEYVVRRYGIPKFIWVYNGYAFESRAITYFGGKYNVKSFLEFEDWHFARERRFSLKPFLDNFFCSLALKYVSGATAVNKGLVDYIAVKNPRARVLEMVGLVDDAVFDLTETTKPAVLQSKSCVKVGYFGGLSIEKGVDLLLDVIAQDSRSDRHYYICGAGPLYDECLRFAKENPKKLTLFSGLKYAQMLELMFDCDILVNPHKVSEKFLNGIFPSKVLESISSGRVVVSTRLPEISNKAALRDVVYFDGTSANMLKKLDFAQDSTENGRQYNQDVVNYCKRNFSSSALRSLVDTVMNHHD